MIILLKLIALTSIWVLGLKIATAEGMVLEKLGSYGKKKVEQGHKIFEAIIVCQWCMPSIHSIVGYLFAWQTGIVRINWEVVKMYPLVVMGASLVSGMTWLVYETLNRIHDRNEKEKRYYDHVEQLAHWDVEDRKKKHRNGNNKKHSL